MQTKRIVSVFLAGVMTLSLLSGCGEKKQSDKIRITVGNWPSEEQKEKYDEYKKMKAEFETANPDIEIVPDSYRYDVKTFNTKAMTNQLPDLYSVVFTEIDQIIKNGYARDITKLAEKYDYDKLNTQGLNFAKDKDGNIFGLPYKVYYQALYINKKIFKEAGLVNGDGSIKVPNTYDEVKEYSKIIREKTGKAGFVYPTTNNCGGWYFMNIAWSYGADFCKKESDGKWKSVFDTPETVEALQFIKDMKWQSDAFLEDNAIDQNAVYKYFGAYQGGMTIADPPCQKLATAYGMDISDIYVTRLPEGPEGRYAQMGGDLWMFSADTTDDQVEAGMKWLQFTGFSSDVNEQQAENLKNSYRTTIEQGGIVLPKETYYVWDIDEYNKKIDDLRAEYANVASEDYEGYYDFDSITIKPEPAACCQQLYAILDGCIQAVIANKDADPAALIKKASEDYQTNHLDKME